MSIALNSTEAVCNLQTFMDLRSHGRCVVRIADLKALEEAKDRYVLAYTKLSDTLNPRAQQASEPVAQHAIRDPQPSETAERTPTAERSTVTITIRHANEVIVKNNANATVTVSVG